MAKKVPEYVSTFADSDWVMINASNHKQLWVAEKGQLGCKAEIDLVNDEVKFTVEIIISVYGYQRECGFLCQFLNFYVIIYAHTFDTVFECNNQGMEPHRY